MDVLRLLRVHQWTKNLFLFLPLFFGQRFLNYEDFLLVFAGFLLFSLAASSVYIINDFMDVEEDKQHPIKKLRPIASGRIKPKKALFLAVILAGTAMLSSAFLLKDFFFLLLIYMTLNLAYSLKLKHIALLDIGIIAFGFVIRVFAGGVLVDVPISNWLIMLTFLISLLLALGKRRDDVLIFNTSGEEMRKAVKGYNLEFINYSMVFVASITLVSYIMYSISNDVILRLGSNKLYITSIFVFFGIMRYLQVVFVENQSGFPTELLLKDRFIQTTVLLWVLSFITILYF